MTSASIAMIAGQHIPELAVTHVGVDLRVVAHTRRRQAKCVHGPREIVSSVALTQGATFREALARQPE